MSGRRTEAGLAALLLGGYGWLFVYFEKINNPNELVRIYAARAIAEHGTYAIGERFRVGDRFLDAGPVYSEWGYVNDKALLCTNPSERPPGCAGKLYAAKAPGTTFLAVPLVGAQRALTRLFAHREPTKTELVFALRWALEIAPTIVFWILFRRFLLAHGVPEAAALACVLCAALGSLSLTYGQMVAGHQTAALAIGSAYIVAFWPKPTATSTATSTPTSTPTTNATTTTTSNATPTTTSTPTATPTATPTPTPTL